MFVFSIQFRNSVRLGSTISLLKRLMLLQVADYMIFRCQRVQIPVCGTLFKYTPNPPFVIAFVATVFI
jgi:hypothetical protein